MLQCGKSDIPVNLVGLLCPTGLRRWAWHFRRKSSETFVKYVLGSKNPIDMQLTFHVVFGPSNIAKGWGQGVLTLAAQISPPLAAKKFMLTLNFSSVLGQDFLFNFFPPLWGGHKLWGHGEFDIAGRVLTAVIPHDEDTHYFSERNCTIQCLQAYSGSKVNLAEDLWVVAYRIPPEILMRYEAMLMEWDGVC